MTIDRSPVLKGRSVFAGRCVDPQTRHLIRVSSAIRQYPTPGDRVGTPSQRERCHLQYPSRTEHERFPHLEPGSLADTCLPGTPPHMRFNLQDVALRSLILIAGGVAALLLVLKGQQARTPDRRRRASLLHAQVRPKQGHRLRLQRSADLRRRFRPVPAVLDGPGGEHLPQDGRARRRCNARRCRYAAVSQIECNRFSFAGN